LIKDAEIEDRACLQFIQVAESYFSELSFTRVC